MNKCASQRGGHAARVRGEGPFREDNHHDNNDGNDDQEGRVTRNGRAAERGAAKKKKKKKKTIDMISCIAWPGTFSRGATSRHCSLQRFWRAIPRCWEIPWHLSKNTLCCFSKFAGCCAPARPKGVTMPLSSPLCIGPNPHRTWDMMGALIECFSFDVVCVCSVDTPIHINRSHLLASRCASHPASCVDWTLLCGFDAEYRPCCRTRHNFEL